MSQSEEAALITILCSAEQSSELSSALASQATDVQTSARRNLDGSATVPWVVIATVAIKTLPDVLRALADFLRRNDVEVIQVGDIVIKNPRPADVEAALRKVPDASGS